MCDHTGVVEDQHTGDIVCRECAFVQDRVYMDASTQTEDIPPWSKGEEYFLRETIMDVCANLHVESSCIVDCALHILKTKLAPKLLKTCNLERESTRIKLAYAIFLALHQQGCPRPPTKISALCGVPVRSFLSLERSLNFSFYSKPSEYLRCACAFVELPYYVEKLCITLCQQYEDDYYGCKPEMLAVACIWSIVSRIHLLACKPIFSHITLEYLSDTFGLGQRSLHRWQSTLPSYFLIPQTQPKKYKLLFPTDV